MELDWTCSSCKRSFMNKDALEKHQTHSRKHSIKYQCESCARSFGSENALRNHLSSPRHVRSTPLDQFFQSFPDFDYNPLSSPATEIGRLQRFYGWTPHSEEGDQVWDRYRNALVREFNSWYGTDSTNLASWQNLCNILRINPLPQSCGSCCEAIRECHVNMVDLINYQRGGLPEVQVFASLNELREYTVRTQRYFPKNSLEAGALLKHLLREIFVH